MKGIYCLNKHEENAEIVYTMASRELIRQVSVHCLERGDVLAEILSFFINKYNEIKENMEIVINNTNKVKKAAFEDFKTKENEFIKKIEQKNSSIEFLQSRVKQKNLIIAEKTDQLNDAIHKLEEYRHKSDEKNMLENAQSFQKLPCQIFLTKTDSALGQKQKNRIKFTISISDQSVQTEYNSEYKKCLNKLMQTERPTLELCKDGFGIEIFPIKSENNYQIVTETVFKYFPIKNPENKTATFDDEKTEFEAKKSIENTEKLKNIEEKNENSSKILKKVKPSTENLKTTDESVKISEANPQKMQFKRKKYIKFSSFKFNTESKNNRVNTQEYEKMLSEKQSEILRLTERLSEQKIELNNLASAEAVNQALVPKISIQEGLIDEKNIDKDFYKSGYELGYTDGYQAGTFAIQEMDDSLGTISAFHSEI